MKKIYLFIYDNSLGSRDQIRNAVDSIPQIVDWIYNMPNSFFLQSESSADQLVDLIKKRVSGERKSFFITEVKANRQGYLPQILWDFINSAK